VLIAMTILGITVTALLSALLTTITSASEHRSVASIDTVARSYAEQLKYDVELQPSGSNWFSQCAPVTATTYAGHTFSPPPNQPAGYTVVIQGIQYWNGSTNSFDASCGPNDMTGFQLVTLSVTAPNEISDTLSVGVRQP
jgi:type II secretory pathway pseudopilin PulG